MAEEYIIELAHVNKSFPGVKALDDVYFNLKQGEVMALLGENGAGKTTLVKVISGVYNRDSGDMSIFGNAVGDMTPRKAQEIGIAIIHQELNMCKHLTVAQNIFLGREIVKNGVLANQEMNEKAAQVLKSLNVDIEPETPVGLLSISKQQMVEIAKAISVNARVLIMDEPTSALTSKEINELFAIIRKLKESGVGVIYISHRLDELQHIADRVTIMRDGKYVDSANFTDITVNEIIAKMVGREIIEKFPRIETKRGKKVFEVKNLNAGPLVRDINLELYAGEIVGVAGLMGAGRSETLRAIFGIDPKISGDIVINNEIIEIKKPVDAIKAGLVLVPEDRKKDGLCVKLSIRENIALPNLDWICNRFGVVKRNMEKELVIKSRDNLKIRMADANNNADSLSGGNQQKVVVGKWIARNSRVVLFDEPTRGIDVAAKIEIYNLMNELKRQGIGVLFVSSEMPEIMGFSDRIIVMCDGRITGEMDIGVATQDKILEMATRFESKFA
ncbi:MAG: sugar ABC transporter ATP-binding protein [Oscillospiraceae bacterium]|nr:sugar ABC transporter ATP-binding protein [Oscillospiraceae bacterium]